MSKIPKSEILEIVGPHVFENYQCAARRTRHRAVYFGGGRQVGELLKHQIKRNPKTIAKNVMADKWANATSNKKSIQKPTESGKKRNFEPS